MAEKKKVCMICAKPSELTICEQCKSNIQGEALDSKSKIEKKVKVEPEILRRKEHSE